MYTRDNESSVAIVEIVAVLKVHRVDSRRQRIYVRMDHAVRIPAGRSREERVVVWIGEIEFDLGASGNDAEINRRMRPSPIIVMTNEYIDRRPNAKQVVKPGAPRVLTHVNRNVSPVADKNVSKASMGGSSDYSQSKHRYGSFKQKHKVILL